MHIAHSHVLLDACCALNLCASRHLLDVLRVTPADIAVAEVVRERELLTLRNVEGTKSEEASQFEIAISKGLLGVVDFEHPEETDAFVNFAAILGDDGESATFAIAIQRGWAIATDDKRAIAFVREQAPQNQVVSTLELVRHWSEYTGVDAPVLRETLLSIRTFGRYMPHQAHPLRQWWEASIGDGDE